MLFPNGVWSGGKWLELIRESGTFDSCRTLGINDEDEVVGWGNHLFQSDPELRGMAIAHWPDPTATPAPVFVDGGSPRYATPFTEHLAEGLAPGSVLSADGRMIAVASELTVGGGGNPVMIPRDRALWTLPGQGRTPGWTQVGDRMVHALTGDIHWGSNPTSGKGQVVAPGVDGELPAIPLNLVVDPNGGIQAFFRNRQAEVFQGGSWKMSFTLGDAIDAAADGTAIRAGGGKDGVMPVLMNGRWRAAGRTTPGLPGGWMEGGAALVDTTPRGWILAKRGTGTQSGDHGVMLPLRMEGHLVIDDKTLTDSVGVDTFSIGSSSPGQAVADRIWIMAPAGGGETTVRLKAPIQPSCKLEISGEGLKFNGDNNSVEVSGELTSFTVKADASVASGTEVPLVFKLKRGDGEVASISSPVMAKVMKRRTIRMRVWAIKADDGSLPAFLPTKARLDGFLNDCFRPQINAVFDSNIEIRGPLDYSSSNGTEFGAPEGAYTPSAEYLEIQYGLTSQGWLQGEVDPIVAGAYVSTFNINLYLVGGAIGIQFPKWNAEEGKMKLLTAAGVADRTPRRCWIAADRPVDEIALLDTIAHEIGHLLFGDGHPNQGTGPAILPGTEMPKRLMFGSRFRKEDGSARLTVKGEWDVAVKWFQDEIDGNRMVK